MYIYAYLIEEIFIHIEESSKGLILLRTLEYNEKVTRRNEYE